MRLAQSHHFVEDMVYEYKLLYNVIIFIFRFVSFEKSASADSAVENYYRLGLS